MIRIFDFNKSHIEEAARIALSNYNEERAAVPALPQMDVLPDLECFADNELGVAAFDEHGMLGFLCCYKPWDHAFGSAAKGTFSPIHAHGAIVDDRGMIYKRLYQAAAEKWIKHQITYHSIGLYVHDTQALNAFFTYGFGLRCIDAIRPMLELDCPLCGEITVDELAKANIIEIRDMRSRLSGHLAESPCFIRSRPEDFQSWISRAESRDSRIFIAKQAEKPIAFIEVMDSGENFATEVSDMKSICGAFCMPAYRGKGISQGLLNHMILQLKDEGYHRLGVDFESFNPTAAGFWLKTFTAYTNGVTRRIDECALRG